MKSRGLLILASVTAISVAAAVWAVVDREQRSRAAAVPNALFPGLTAQVNEVAKVEVSGPGIDFTIAKGADGDWTVPEKGGYPVKFETVKQAVVGMASLKPLEPRTGKPELHSKLNLRLPSDGGRGTVLTLKDSDGNELASVVVGKTRSVATKARPGWHYVRKAGEDQSWLAEGRVEVWNKIERWLDPDMPIVERRRIHIVRRTLPGGDTIEIAKDDPQARDFTILDIPEGFRALHDTVANPLGSALGFLTFEDVMPAKDKPLENTVLASYVTYDGLVVDIHLMKQDDDIYWARFEGRYDPDEVRLDTLNEDQRESMKSETEVREEAEKINSRYGDWAYKLPSYKGKDFFISREELLIEIKEGDKTGG